MKNEPEGLERPRLGRALAHFNRRVTNPLARPLAQLVPGLGVIIHTGRKSKHPYRTPVAVFRSGDEYVIALTYGPGCEWVKNVLAASGCELVTLGRHHRLGSPEIIHDERRQLVPPLVRPALRFLRAADFLRLSSVGSEAGPLRE